MASKTINYLKFKKELDSIKEIWLDFISLFYPINCKACNNTLISGENWICTTCLLDIPKSDYWLDINNPVNQLFWGKTKIEFASAFLLFSKGSRYRKLIHSLKYLDDQESGIKLGSLYGKEIFKASEYKNFDFIIPVPLHPKKQRKRGYNQSECIAKGLSESLGIETLNKVLIRTVNTATQTNKHKDERWNNVSGVFDIQNPEILQGKHVLLVDDVITTGATIEHCAMTLINNADCKVSIGCIARA